VKIRIVVDGKAQSIEDEMPAPAVVTMLGKDPADGWVLRRKAGTYVGETGRIGDLVNEGEALELVQVDRP
jgi:hypothetical protein